jgi:tRNA (adenine57-N1/adenine58-N1)-methyltransferase
MSEDSFTVSDGDLVLLIDINKLKNKYMVRITTSNSNSLKKISGLGVLNLNKLVGKKYGSIFEFGRKKLFILQPDIMDKLDSLQRKAQIITPKDSAVIAINCDIKNGDYIIEGGLGSGAMTIVMANLVKPEGKIITYEKSAANINIGVSNLKKCGLDNIVEIKNKDITKGISEKNINSIVLDIPEPWLVVKHAYMALNPGGHFASYSPTMNQVELTINEIRNHNFLNPYTIETLQREIIVGEGGTRPSFEMLGHTGYITFARKVLDIQ